MIFSANFIYSEPSPQPPCHHRNCVPSTDTVSPGCSSLHRVPRAAMGGQWLSWLLVCLCLVRGRCGGLRDLHTEFAVRLYQAHADRGSNLIVSPLSISMALGLLQFGARVRSLAQLEEALGYNVKGKTYQHCPWKSGPIIQSPDIYQNQTMCMYRSSCNMIGGGVGNSSRRVAVRLACALFIQHDISLLPAFTQHASAWGNSSLVQTSFNQPNQTISQLEDWIRRNADADTEMDVQLPIWSDSPEWAGPHMALVSTLAFRSTWQRCFHLGEELPFTLANGSVTKVPMMHQLTEARFGHFHTPMDLRYSVLELPYLGGYFGLLVVQPSDRKMPLSQLETQLSGHAVTMWHSSLHRIKMDIFLPRFRIHSKSSLRSVLPSLGVSDIFDPTVADFTGISAEEGLYVSEALQEAVVEVMENGTKAEAVTAVVLLKRSRAPVFKADRPFLFLLKQVSTGTILFIGRMLNPAEQKL
ncbi:LOW QUALITY PROTEIN: probable serpin E3 [Paramormyrops kingsleyae]|uniref:LOW QUALITY PROTEIN: probable serpin E3 n=1 Tax=Paramormyrops kingsleyae TaxID=1676925 RepID=UPI003B971D9A